MNSLNIYFITSWSHWSVVVLVCPQQASYHADVSEDVRARAFRYGTECTLGYLELLEHVLLVRKRPLSPLPESIEFHCVQKLCCAWVTVLTVHKDSWMSELPHANSHCTLDLLPWKAQDKHMCTAVRVLTVLGLSCPHGRTWHSEQY